MNTLFFQFKESEEEVLIALKDVLKESPEFLFGAKEAKLELGIY
jgi:hypothetical protein